MDDRDMRLDRDESDLEMEALFAPMAKLRASEELKASTLAAIFAELDAEEAQSSVAASVTPEEAPEEGRELRLVPEEAAPANRRRRVGGWRMRVAAALVAASLVTGGVAYAVPTSHVVVSQDDVTVSLGVNVFGVAVSVETDDDELDGVLKEAHVRNRGYEEALGRVLDACESRHAAGDGVSGELTVAVTGASEGRVQEMEEAAWRVVAERFEEEPATPSSERASEERVVQGPQDWSSADETSPSDAEQAPIEKTPNEGAAIEDEGMPDSAMASGASPTSGGGEPVPAEP